MSVKVLSVKVLSVKVLNDCLSNLAGQEQFSMGNVNALAHSKNHLIESPELYPNLINELYTDADLFYWS